MNKAVTKSIATSGIIVILSCIVLFHVLVMLGIIPFGIVWGGRLKSSSQMLMFEITSIIINLTMLTVVGVHAGVLNVRVNRKVVKSALWVMFALFLLNTVGNLFSNNETEKLIFTPLTILLSLFCLRLAVSRDAESAH
ncbi:hypothetical protein POKO110462_10430 [Pontibacter korlensis]|uniref:Uncharacterized protein n=1 Tax=Pontibacter korlensis TaxID=400092 RepID=A0A0E3ZDQ3_9BACT|nr:hypothetical protein [Pontibacter korlensis]AKD02433.1 hypothetical protein PKOR_03965 [Pontibacter korlensis]